MINCLQNSCNDLQTSGGAFLFGLNTDSVTSRTLDLLVPRFACLRERRMSKEVFAVFLKPVNIKKKVTFEQSSLCPDSMRHFLVRK